jgi:hypothetical protein
MWKRWYNSDCLEGKETEYGEWADFHNANMVPLGYEPMLTKEQEVLRKEFDEALQYVYGDWAKEYGIGKEISNLIGKGFPGGRYYSPPAEGKVARILFNSVQLRLEKALEEWKELKGKLYPDFFLEEKEPYSELAGEEEEYEDYEYEEGCEEEGEVQLLLVGQSEEDWFPSVEKTHFVIPEDDSAWVL